MAEVTTGRLISSRSDEPVLSGPTCLRFVRSGASPSFIVDIAETIAACDFLSWSGVATTSARMDCDPAPPLPHENHEPQYSFFALGLRLHDDWTHVAHLSSNGTLRCADDRRSLDRKSTRLNSSH